VPHPLGRKTRVVPRLQPLCTGSVKVGSVGQKVVGRNTLPLCAGGNYVHIVAAQPLRGTQLAVLSTVSGGPKARPNGF
jgi:hypothetical protein